jgi:hypothetical protein
MDYTLGKKKLTGEKLKVKKSRIKHKLIMLGDLRRKEKTSSIEEEDKSLIKRKDNDLFLLTSLEETCQPMQIKLVVDTFK